MWFPMMEWLRRKQSLWRIPESTVAAGQGLVEYALILILVSLVVLVLVAIIGPWLSNAYLNVVMSI
jgi:pilus assembly protein Flp/PilA